MTNSEAALPSSEAWQAEGLRLTVFPTEGYQAKEQQLWRELVGEEPDSKTDLSKQQAHVEKGALESGRLTLQVKTNRMDWLLGPKAEEQRQPFATIGQFNEVLPMFTDLMLRWLGFESRPPVQRLAFAATLVQQVQDQEAGYERLAAYLHSVTVDTRNSCDLAYQINRPRSLGLSGMTDFRVNRLSKWYVMAVVAGPLLPGPPIRFPSTEHYACRLELDINTAQEFEGELSDLSNVLKLLVELGKEIAEGGDKS